MPAEIYVKEMLLDAVLVSAKDVMVLLASVKRTLLNEARNNWLLEFLSLACISLIFAYFLS